MKTKLILPIIIVLLAMLGGIVCFQGAYHTKPNLSAQRLGDKGVFIGDSTKQTNGIKPYKHQEAIRAIDVASEYRLSGDSFSREGLLDKASEEYKKAYMIDVGSRAVSGFLLAETYEKLGRYDDAITQLNQMIQNGEFSKLGIQDAKKMIDRLLAAKSQAAQKTEPISQ